MKRILSTIIASLVAIAFAGIAFAAEPAMTPGHPEAAVKTTPATPAKPDTYKTVKPGAAKKSTARKHHKKHTRKHKTCKPAAKKSEAPASAPVTK